MQRVFLFILIIALCACGKIRYYEDNPIVPGVTQILSHRGAVGVDSVLENTLRAVHVGLAHLDGVEVDVLLSAENTLWLGHNPKIIDCDGKEQCFRDLTHQELLAIQRCDEEESFSRLEAVFIYMSAFYPDKYISLDIKRPECGVFAQEEYDIVAQEIVDLAKAYDMEGNVLVESANKKFLNTLTELSSEINLYFLAWGEYDYGLSVAIDNDLAGISFDFNRGYEITSDHVDLAHRKGVKMMLWVINDAENMNQIYDMNPDFIQTDSLTFYDYIY